MEDIHFTKHHAYFIFGGDKELSRLRALLEKKMNFSFLGNPDFWFEETDTFGIEESRTLKEVHSRKPLGKIKVFIIKTSFITNEAQNALLKILEDPLPHSFFFFIMPSDEYILPTLLSRFMIINDGSRAEDKSEPEFDVPSFLSLNPAKRIKLLSKIVDAKDKEKALKFLNSLEKELRKKYYPFSSGALEAGEIFRTLLQSKKYLYSRGASVKIILENLSLVLPQAS